MIWKPCLAGCLWAVVSLSAVAADDPPCMRFDGAVKQMDDDPNVWLTREAGADIKAKISKANGKYKGRWEGDTLITACSIGGGTAYDMPAVSVVDGTTDSEKARLAKQHFRDLAASSGHSRQEADALTARYLAMGGYSPYVRDEQGRQVSAADEIYERHKRKLGIGPSAAPTLPANANQRAADLKQQIAAAKKRGDMNEVMRLAGEAQNLVAPVAAQSAEMSNQAQRDAWDLAVSVVPDLAQVRYRTRVTRLPSSCLGCALPE